MLDTTVLVVRSLLAPEDPAGGWGGSPIVSACAIAVTFVVSALTAAAATAV